MRLELVPEGDLRNYRCGQPSPGGRMRCEWDAPTAHDRHVGRDRLGRWRWWDGKADETGGQS